MLKENRMDANFRKRLQRHLYYGGIADLDKPSLPLTGLAVDYFRDTVPEKLGHVDLYTASNVIKSNRVSPCSVVLSMLYAKRLRHQNKEYLQSMSSSDVFFISVMMASKYLYDEGVDEEVFNDEWAENSNQDVDDVNQMEIDFLQAMDWRLFARPEEFEDIFSAIERRLAFQEGIRRGWFTYSELDVILTGDLVGLMWNQVGAECSKLMTALSAAYLTSFWSMLGSTAVAAQVAGPLSSATVALLTSSCSMLPCSVWTDLTPVGDMQYARPPLPSVKSGGLRDPNETEIGQEEMDQILSESLEVQDQTLAIRSDKHGSPGVSLTQFSFDVGGGTTELLSRDERRSPDGGLICAKTSGGSCDNKSGSESPLSKQGSPPTSSLWSLWFFDSLISQIWAVTAIKSKVAQFVGNSFPTVFSNSAQEMAQSSNSASHPATPCHGRSSTFRQHQRFRQRRKILSAVKAEEDAASSLSTDPGQDDKCGSSTTFTLTNGWEETKLDKAYSSSTCCYNRCCCSPAPQPYGHLEDTLGSTPGNEDLACIGCSCHLADSTNLDPLTLQSPSHLAQPLSTSSRHSHAERPGVCHDCQVSGRQVEVGVNQPEPRREQSLHDQNLSRDVAKTALNLPLLHNQSTLLQVPHGFFTGILQALQAT